MPNGLISISFGNAQRALVNEENDLIVMDYFEMFAEDLASRGRCTLGPGALDTPSPEAASRELLLTLARFPYFAVTESIYLTYFGATVDCVCSCAIPSNLAL